MARLEVSRSTTTPVELNVGGQLSIQRTHITVHPAWMKYRNDRLTQLWPAPQPPDRPTSKDILRTKYNAVGTIEKINDLDNVTYLDFDTAEDMMVFLLEWS